MYLSPFSFMNYCDSFDVPDTVDEPLRDNTNWPPKIPCFIRPDCVGLPEGSSCLDLFCNAGKIDWPTNINGRFAVYFNTRSHGGDNFSFKATTANSFYGLDLHDCIVASAPATFTLFRRIWVDDAWMEEVPKPKNEHQGNYDIPGNNTWYYQGVFDDCFIEINPQSDQQERVFPDTNYVCWIHEGGNGYAWYADQYVPGFRNPYMKDHALLTGIDHFDICGPNDKFGITTHLCYFDGPEKAYSYVGVGNFTDKVKRGYKRRINGLPCRETAYLSMNTAAHELAHNINRCSGNNLDSTTETTHGLMHYNDRRSYLNWKHILWLRNENKIFDRSVY